jgi:hypothetical protein
VSDAALEEAGRLAERLGSEIQSRAGDLTPAFRELEAAVRHYQQEGGAVDEIMPGSPELALGFRRGQPDGKSIWSAYADVLRDDVCRADGDLHRQLTQGAAATGASVVTLLLGALGLPLVAAPIMAPMAGSLLALGVKAFCARLGEPVSTP